MPIECPRCLQTNPDSSLSCDCGHDLTALIRRRLMLREGQPPSSSSQMLEKPLTHWHFSIGVAIIGVLLIAGEGIRLKLDLGSRVTSQLVIDSVMIGLTDLAGALGVGALAWIIVWVIRSYDEGRFRPCPKRTTLGTTICAAALIFLARLTPPDIASYYFNQGLVYLAIGIPIYFAGSRHWLGKW
ncbi:MAG: conserved membrane protein of unknown function [Nitrospira sp.]|nr:MAG: conserved membrane protein of unknown function [Nitrospira sp.]